MKELYQFYMHSCAKAGEGTKLIKDSTQADEAVLERFDIGCCEDEPDFTPPPLDRHQYFFAMVSYRHLSELIDRSFGTVMLAVTQEKTCVIVVSGLVSPVPPQRLLLHRHMREGRAGPGVPAGLGVGGAAAGELGPARAPGVWMINPRLHS